MTVAQELAKKTGYVVLHNHRTIDLVMDYFPFGSRKFNYLLQSVRMEVIKSLMRKKVKGIVLTSGFPKSGKLDFFYGNLEKMIKKTRRKITLYSSSL